MLDITIDKDIFEMPESWDELTLRDYTNITKILADQDKYISDNQIWVELVSKVLKCKKEILLNLSQEDFETLCLHLKWITLNPDEKKVDVITINGILYAFKENTKFNMSERITTETILERYKTLEDQFPYILAVILRPCTEEINPETGIKSYNLIPLSENWSDIEARANIFMDGVMMGDVYGSLLFFSHTEKHFSTRTMAHSSSLKIEKRVK